MYYWKSPTASIDQFSRECSVDGEVQTMTSIAGTFDWNNMFLTWKLDPEDAYGNLPSAAKRKAVSKLTYNIGVALGMEYGTYGSNAPDGCFKFVDAVKNVFGYKSGTCVLYYLYALDSGKSQGADFEERKADFNNALYASLDAKMPVFMSIEGNVGGHAIVADGYGYISGRRYTHLNFGYGSEETPADAWYCLIDETLVTYGSSENYWRFMALGFNLHPTTAGDVISGRVLNSSSSPVSGATVTLYDSSNNAKATASTDAKGIYSFRITAAGNYSVKATSGSQVSPSKSVSVAALSRGGSCGSSNEGALTGNRWVNDLTLGAASTYTLTCNPNGGKLKGDNFGTHNGTTSSHNITVTYGAASYSTLGTATKDGYTFKGWYTATSGGTQVFNSSGKCVTGTAYWNSSGKWAYQNNLTIYAQWTQNSAASTSNVGFNPNGGTLSGGNFGSKNGTTQTATLTLTYGKGSYNSGMRAARGTGYSFNGFWTAASGGSQIYDANGKYVPNSLCWTSSGTWKHTGNAMLYAQWHTHSVKFDPNGGTLSGGNFGAKNGTTQVASLQVTCGAGAYNSGMRATKSGSAFNGWWTAASGGSKQYDASGKFVANSTCWDANGKWKHHGNAALYAHWAQGTQLTANPYGGKLNGGNFGSDNGTTSSHTVDVTYGGKAFNTLGTATRSGYVFKGWYTSTSGGYMVFDPNGKFVEGDYWDSDGKWKYTGSAVTVYARWLAAGTTYTLTCKPQGGTLKGNNFGSDNGTSKSHDVSVVTGSGAYNVLGTATKNGYKFLGWYSDPSSGTKIYDANGKFVVSWCWNAAGQWIYDGNPTIYARWAEASTLTCNPNGGKLNGSNFGSDNGKATSHSVILAKGTSAYSTLGTATKDGYVFMGWYTADDKPVYDYDGKAWTRSSTVFWNTDGSQSWKTTTNVTVYAKWESRSTYTLTCDPNGGTLKGNNFGSDNGTSKSHAVNVTVGASAYNVLGTAVRPGYKFTGWYRGQIIGYMQYGLMEQVFDENGKWVPMYMDFSGPWMWSKTGVWMCPQNITILAGWEAID
jgi:uncharacterized repeat protein (TIGR02543 family)